MSRLAILLICILTQFSALAGPPLPKRPINLNTASVRQLMVLPGIGRHRAQKIVLMRERKPFRRTSELLKIRGIGRKMYHRLRPLVKVEWDKKAPQVQK